MTKKIALIGVGVVGERILKQLLENEHYEVKGIYDTDATRLEKIAAQYDMHTYENIEQILEETLDYIYIGTPPASHRPLATQFAKRGVHILCEKPLADCSEEGVMMVEAVAEAGVQTAMHFPMMYSAEVAYVKALLEAGELGDVLQIELSMHFPTWPRSWQQNNWIATRAQGGFIREIFPHYFQLTNHLFGAIEIEGHRTIYPSNIELCETATYGFGQVKEDIPIIWNAIAGTAEKERIDYKIVGSLKTVTIRNWSEVWESCNGEEEVRQVIPERNTSYAQAIIMEENLVSFEEGLMIQRWIDELLR